MVTVPGTRCEMANTPPNSTPRGPKKAPLNEFVSTFAPVIMPFAVAKEPCPDTPMLPSIEPLIPNVPNWRDEASAIETPVISSEPVNVAALKSIAKRLVPPRSYDAAVPF